MTNTTVNAGTLADEDKTLVLMGKIEKLWRRANDPNNHPAEREAAEAKALSLMESARITHAMLKEVDSNDVLGDHLYGKLRGTYGRLHLEFINRIASAFDCKVWWSHYGTNYTVYLTGFKSDANKVKALSEFLLIEATNGASRVTYGDRGETMNYRRAFVNSFGYEVGQRLREAAQMARDDFATPVEDLLDEAQVDSWNDADWDVYEAADGDIDKANEIRKAQRMTGAELVLVARKEQVNEFYAKKKMRHAGAISGAYSARGRADGGAAGRSVSLGGNRNQVGGGVKALGR